MSYASQSDMIERFGAEDIEALTDHEGAGQIDAEALARALGDADAQIDAILARRYDVPLTVVPDHVVRVACDLARANLYDHDIPEHVAHLRDMAIAWLKDVAAAKADLPGVDEKTGAASAGSAELVSGDRVFSRDTLSDF